MSLQKQIRPQELFRPSLHFRLPVDVNESYFPSDVGVAGKHSFTQNNPSGDIF